MVDCTTESIATMRKAGLSETQIIEILSKNFNECLAMLFKAWEENKNIKNQYLDKFQTGE